MPSSTEACFQLARDTSIRHRPCIVCQIRARADFLKADQRSSRRHNLHVVVALANTITSASEVDPDTLQLDVQMPAHWRERVMQGMWNGMVLVHRVVPEDRLWIEDPWILARPEIVDGCVVHARTDEETELYNSSQAPRYGFTDEVRDLDELSRVAGMGEPRWLSKEGIGIALARHQCVTFLSGRLKRAPSNR